MEKPSGNRTVSDWKRKSLGTPSLVGTSFGFAVARSSTTSGVWVGGGLALPPFEVWRAVGAGVGASVEAVEAVGGAVGAVAGVADAGAERDVDNGPEHDTNAAQKRTAMTMSRATLMG